MNEDKNAPSKSGEDDFELMEALAGPSILSPYAPVIIIRGEITDRTAGAFRNAVDKLKYQRHAELAMLEINSVGGDVFAAFEILNTMDASGMDWITYNASHAFSAGALLLSAGTAGARFAARKSSTMIHGISGSMGFKGVEDAHAEVHHDMQLNDMLLDVIAKNCKMPLSKLKKIIKDSGSRDLFLMPEEALKLKLVDHVDEISIEPVQGFQLKCTQGSLEEKKKQQTK